MLSVIITGSTGMVGRGALLECIDSPDVESILLVNRNPIDIKHPKVKEVLIRDFFNLDSIRNDLSGYNTCFYCMGVTSVGAKEDEYIRIMYEAPMSFARQLLSLNPDMVFCFVSGKGTDSTEKGNAMWARVKGKAENGILALGFRDAYIFRPGLIVPRRGIKSRTGWYNVFYTATKPLNFLFKRMPKYVTDTATMGKAMILVSKSGYPEKVLESQDINQYVEQEA